MLSSISGIRKQRASAGEKWFSDRQYEFSWPDFFLHCRPTLLRSVARQTRRYQRLEVELVLHNEVDSKIPQASSLALLSQLLLKEEQDAYEKAARCVSRFERYSYHEIPRLLSCQASFISVHALFSACSRPRDTLKLMKNNAVYEHCLVQLVSDHVLPLLR